MGGAEWGSKLGVLAIWHPSGGTKKTFLLLKIFEKFKKDEHGHGMYFLKIYIFGEVSQLLGVGGGPKVKNVKNSSSKNMHFLQKIDFPEKF